MNGFVEDWLVDRWIHDRFSGDDVRCWTDRRKRCFRTTLLITSGTKAGTLCDLPNFVVSRFVLQTTPVQISTGSLLSRLRFFVVKFSARSLLLPSADLTLITRLIT
jgi:hypothetical protein